MDRARDDLLTGARLALDEHVRVGPGGDAHERAHLGHGAARTDEPVDWVARCPTAAGRQGVGPTSARSDVGSSSLPATA
jgi:hypothetical protein